MTYFWGALAGLLWGAVGAVIIGIVSKKCVKKNTPTAMTISNIVKFGVYIVSFTVVFLLRNMLPFSYEAAVMGMVLSLAILQIVFTFKIVNS